MPIPSRWSDVQRQGDVSFRPGEGPFWQGVDARDPWWHPQAIWAADFAGGRYAGAASTLTGLLTTTRASTHELVAPDGTIRSFPVNALARIDGLGAYIGGAATNYFLNSAAPATQTIALPSTGKYTLAVVGAGSVALAAGTATLAGAGTASAGAPLTVDVSAIGTVECTVTGTPTRVDLQKLGFAAPPIPTAGAAATRNASDVAAASFGWFGAAGLGDGFTVLADFDLGHTGEGANRYVFDFSNGTENERATLLFSTADTMQLTTNRAGPVWGFTVPGAFTPGPVRCAARFVDGAWRLASTGRAAVASALTGKMPVDLDRLIVGKRWAGTGHLNEIVRELQIARPLSDAEMDQWIGS